MIKVALFFFCLTGFIAIRFFGVDDDQFRQALYEEAEVHSKA